MYTLENDYLYVIGKSRMYAFKENHMHTMRKDRYHASERTACIRCNTIGKIIMLGGINKLCYDFIIW